MVQTGIVCTLCLIIITMACSPLGEYRLHSQNNRADAAIKVIIDERPDASILPNLVGFSIEMSQLCALVQVAHNNPTYMQYYKNLGSSILRIGGNSVDDSVWAPHGQASCATRPAKHQQRTVITRQLINQLFTFARQIHWRVIWGLNLAANDPVATADEAANVAQLGGASLLGFTIGNEPELYAQRGFRSDSWNERHFQYEWSQYITRIRQRVNAEFVGPEACCATSLFNNFLQSDASTNIGVSSHHLYAITNTVTGKATPSIPLLLSATTLQNEKRLLDQWTHTAATANTSLALTEVNSVSGGGLSGISNTLAAALWADDLLFQAALRPITSVDFHNTSSASYNALTVNGQVTPLYYGLLLFHYATHRARWLHCTIQYAERATPNVSAYALRHADGTTSLFVINKEPARGASIKIALTHQSQLSQTYTHTTLVSLTGPAINATSGITLGARTLSAAGTWSPTAATTTRWNESMPLIVNAGSATLITLN